MIQPYEILHCATTTDITRFIGDNTGSSKTIAVFVMNVVDWILGYVGLSHNITVVTVLYAAVVLGI